MSNTTTISHIPAEELWRLLDHLEKFAPSEETSKKFAISRLTNFFTGMTVLQRVQLETICELRNNDLYASFVRDYPDIAVNLKGTSPIQDVSGWEVKSLALDYKYQLMKESKSSSSYTKQIVKAAELSCLKKAKADEYSALKLRFFVKYKNDKSYIPINFDLYAGNESLDKYFDSKAFMAAFLSYLIRCDMKYWQVFAEYITYRLDCIIGEDLEKNKLENESNLKFIETVKNIKE